MAYKVIQWATGKLGGEIMKEVIQRPEFDLVGVFVYSVAKHGVDAGELVGLPETGVKATTNREDIFAMDADLVIHAPQLQPTMDEHDRDVIRLLESGKNVISIMGYFNPQGVGGDYAARLAAACRKGGASLFGTGINPGFVCERLATTISGICTEIRHIHVLEAYDCSCSPALMLQVMGFGMTPEAFHASGIGGMWDSFFWGIPHETVERMGGKIDRIERSYEIELSDVDQTDGAIPVPVAKGTVAGSNWKWTAFVHGKPFFTLETQWQVGKPIAGWETRSGWTITIDGTPSVRMQVQNASSVDNILNGAESEYNAPLMAALVLNAAPDVIAAPPGLFRAPVFAPYRIRSAEGV